MKTIQLTALNDFEEWRAAARALLLEGVPPEAVNWREPGAAGDLFGSEDAPTLVTERRVGTVPERFLELGAAGICHSDPERFGLLYRLLWRLLRDRDLLQVRSDPDVGRLDRRVSAVRRDSHKMKAFVRFRSVPAQNGEEQFLAWFEPEHYVVERVAPFFARRFAGMQWGIVTPYRSVRWDGDALSFGPGGSRDDVPAEDAMEDAWRAYYAAIFNPARLKVKMMKSEMPVKYWRNLPEAELIAPLIRNAQAMEAEMLERQANLPSAKHVRRSARQAEAEPATGTEADSLDAARAAVAACTRCPLHEMATQVVFGSGPEAAEAMFVGEQPGDQEDLAGQPFVGPAGQVFDAALKEAGIARERIYVTNAVKHFKFVPRGKRRLHQKPNAGEISACRYWLDLERTLVKPRLIVAMGATAVTGVLGPGHTLGSVRGRVTPLADGTQVYATVHPSYLLRLPDRVQAARERAQFVADMRAIRALIEG